MLIAIGPNVGCAQMYTNAIDDASIEISSAQGNTEDTFKCQIWDPNASYGIQVEDEVHVIDETDQNGWPSVNLLANSSFEGTASGGVASSWTGYLNGGTGATFSVSASVVDYGAQGQQLTLTNATTSTYYQIVQKVTLPSDENYNVLRAQPYYFSAYYLITGALSGCALGIAINWYDSSDTYISSSTATQNVSSVTYGWQRMWTTDYAPSNAVSARVTLQLHTSSATNSGTVVFDAAQFEYATYGAYQSTSFAINATNPGLHAGTGGAVSVADGWQQNTDGATGITWSVGTFDGETAQNLAFSSVAASTFTYGISQSSVLFNPLQVYALQVQYQVTAQMGPTTRMRLGFQYEDANGGFITGYLVEGPLGEGVSVAWETLQLSVGPYTGHEVPAGARRCKIYAGIVNPGTGTDTCSISIAGFQLAAAPSGGQLSAAGLSSLQAGQYPTPYIDPHLAGDGVSMVWQDREVTNLYYRQQRLFAGYVRHAKRNFSSGPECVWDIDAVDFGVILAEALIVLVVRGQNILYAPTAGESDSQAIGDMCTYAHNQGYLQGLDWTTHVANLTTIPAMSFNWATVHDAMSAIADITVAAYWVDPYRYLWYQAALSVSSGFTVSMTPDYATSYPFENWSIDLDSTQTRTSMVVQGATQLSAPTTSQVMYGYSGTIQSAYTNGQSVNSLHITGNTAQIAQGCGVLGGTNSSGFTFVTTTDIPPTPQNGPSLTAATGTSTFTSGAVYVRYRWVYLDPVSNTGFSTVSSPATSVSVTGTGQVINVASITAPTSGQYNAHNISSIDVFVSGAAGSTTCYIYTSVTATNGVVPAFTISGYGNTSGSGAPTSTCFIPVIATTVTTALASGAAATAVRFTVNGGSPLYAVNTVTVGGVNQTIGQATTSNGTGSYQCYADPQPAQVTFDPSAYPANAAAVQITYTFENPVLVRVTTQSGANATKQRQIAFYQNVTNIQSIADAIDMANAQLAQFAKAQPIGHLRLHWPPCPGGYYPHQGQYITIVHPPSLGTQPTKFQIQKVSTKVMGNGIIVRDFDLGFYRPDLATQMAQVTQDAAHLAADQNASTVLNDVLSASDGWTMGDGVSASVSNNAVWGTNNWNDGTAWA